MDTEPVVNKLFEAAHTLRGMATAACQRELIYTVVKFVKMADTLERMAQDIERQIASDKETTRLR